MDKLILRLSCPDRIGISHDVNGIFARHDCNIVQSHQHLDPLSGQFFMRVAVEPCGDEPGRTSAQLEAMRANLEHLADRYQMRFQLESRAKKTRVMVAVSKWGHCLTGLLEAARRQASLFEIVGVVSNHEDMRSLAEWHGAPYHYLPVDPQNKRLQEQSILQLMETSGAELLALARYMQVLSPELCETLADRAINIHHSFLPGFKGAKPYERAYERGVKFIGATAHFVTGDLDEGPIIEQDVERVSHADSARDLIEIGRRIEEVVLTRAVNWFAERRILRNGIRVVVFR